MHTSNPQEISQRHSQPAHAWQLDQLVAFVEGRPHSLPDFAEPLAAQETIEGMLNGCVKDPGM